LGSGYHIALKDIEIRGVGNILGSKQHGHMVSVGFDTYCNLLEECINELKSKEPPKKPVITTIDLNVTAFIPDEWVGSVEQKILEYKRLSDVKTPDELENMALSLKDRFSKLPQSVENLIKLIKLRLLANSCNITLIREAGDTIRVYTPFTLKEWLIIRNTSSENVKKYITFQNPPKALTDTKGILLVNKRNKNFDEIFNMLGDLFYHINRVILDFNQKMNKKE
jgi:transcription-repair coupling factor (superfamily II helicase)